MASSSSYLRGVSRLRPSVRAKRSVSFVPGEYGSGGRHSVSGLNVAVFGATGFLGRYVVAELGAVGSRCIVGNRGDEMETRHLKVNFDHGRFHAPFYSVRYQRSIKEVIGSCDVVINMIGKYYETKGVVPTRRDGTWQSLSRVNYSYEAVNVDAARAVAKAAKACGASTLIHVSALCADEASPSVNAATKAAGEKAVLAEFPEATIVRPTTLFGHEDRLLNWFAGMATMPGMVVPLVEDGASLLQPAHVNDVAKVVMRIVENAAEYKAKVVELAGPEEYTRRELAEFTFDITKQEAKLIDVPAQLADLAAGVLEQLPDPIWTRDEVAQAQIDQVLDPSTENLVFGDFGIAPTSIEKVAFAYLHRYREGGHFIITKGYHG